jgi:hypothetical protein
VDILPIVNVLGSRWSQVLILLLGNKLLPLTNVSSIVSAF